MSTAFCWWFPVTKTESSRDTNFVVNGGTEGCQPVVSVVGSRKGYQAGNPTQNVQYNIGWYVECNDVLSH